MDFRIGSDLRMKWRCDKWGKKYNVVDFVLTKTEDYEYERKMKLGQLAMNEINH